MKFSQLHIQRAATGFVFAALLLPGLAQAATAQPNLQLKTQSNTPPQAQSATPQTTAGGTLERVRNAGKIVFGYYSDQAPMSYRDTSGQPVGYAVHLCHKVADSLKAQLQLPTLAVEWVAVTAATSNQDVQQGRIDLLCTPAAATLAQRQSVSFSAPIFSGGMAALVRTNAPAEFQRILENRPHPYKPIWRGTPPAALQYKTVSVVAGSPAVGMVAERISALKIIATISTEETYAAAVAKVASGKSDVLFGERIQLQAHARQSPAAKDLKVLTRRFTYETLALTLARNDDDFRLAVDRALADFLATPKFGELYETTFGKADADTIEFFRNTPH